MSGHLGEVASWAAAVVAVGAALAVLYRAAWWLIHAGRKADALGELIERELSPNHGTSMKDQSSVTAHLVAKLDGRLRVVERELFEHLRLNAMTLNNAVYTSERAADVADAAAASVNPTKGRHT